MNKNTAIKKVLTIVRHKKTRRNVVNTLAVGQKYLTNLENEYF